jgi:hypothetical protein
MTDHGQAKTAAAIAGKSRVAPVAPVSYPDEATCRTKPAEVQGFYECLSFWGAFCPHILLVDRKRFCDHPTNHEIYLRTAEKTAS